MRVALLVLSLALTTSGQLSGRSCSPDCFPNNGHCVDGMCICVGGWSGVACHQPLCPGNCNGRGTCVGPNVCQCLDGISGLQCDTVNDTGSDDAGRDATSKTLLVVVMVIVCIMLLMCIASWNKNGRTTVVYPPPVQPGTTLGPVVSRVITTKTFFMWCIRSNKRREDFFDNGTGNGTGRLQPRNLADTDPSLPTYENAETDEVLQRGSMSSLGAQSFFRTGSSTSVTPTADRDDQSSFAAVGTGQRRQSLESAIPEGESTIELPLPGAAVIVGEHLDGGGRVAFGATGSSLRPLEGSFHPHTSENDPGGSLVPPQTSEDLMLVPEADSMSLRSAPPDYSPMPGCRAELPPTLAPALPAMSYQDGVDDDDDMPVAVPKAALSQSPLRPPPQASPERPQPSPTADGFGHRRADPFTRPRPGIDAFARPPIQPGHSTVTARSQRGRCTIIASAPVARSPIQLSRRPSMPPGGPLMARRNSRGAIVDASAPQRSREVDELRATIGCRRQLSDHDSSVIHPSRRATLQNVNDGVDPFEAMADGSVSDGPTSSGSPLRIVPERAVRQQQWSDSSTGPPAQASSALNLARMRSKRRISPLPQPRPGGSITPPHQPEPWPHGETRAPPHGSTTATVFDPAPAEDAATLADLVSGSDADILSDDERSRHNTNREREMTSGPSSPGVGLPGPAAAFATNPRTLALLLTSGDADASDSISDGDPAFETDVAAPVPMWQQPPATAAAPRLSSHSSMESLPVYDKLGLH